MEKLHPLVSFYKPEESSTVSDQQPRLIIVSGWTDAKDAHVAKYVTNYQALYPAAQILLLRSTMSCILRPSQIGPAMHHAVPVIRAAFQAPIKDSSSPPLLVHIFSNGGSSSVANLYEQYAASASPSEDKRLPPHVTIFDSTPGLFRLPCTVAFVSVGLSSFQRLIATPFLYAFGALWAVSMTIGLLPNSLTEWYHSHNHHTANAAEIRRAYIYSPADLLTDYKDVEAHAAEAEAKGFSIVLEKYENSAHVAHLRKDESRYWDIVKRTMQG